VKAQRKIAAGEAMAGVQSTVSAKQPDADQFRHPKVAADAATPVDTISPARELQQQLEARLAASLADPQSSEGPPDPKKWNGFSSLIFIVGSSLGLWAIIGAIVNKLL
jgi:hypothetical protein